jgi:hypothetical protein
MFKYEFQATGRILLPLNLIMLIVTFLGRITIFVEHTVIPDDDTILDTLLTTFYFVMIIALGVVTLVILVRRFYKNLFTDEGYLSFTLPVSPLAHLNVKLFTAFAWDIIGSITFVLSILILTADTELFSDIMQAWPNIVSTLETVGMPVGSTAAWLIAILLVGSLTTILSFYCAIVIGQMFNRHRVAAAVVTYVIIYIINQIIATVVMSISAISLIDDSYTYLVGSSQIQVLVQAYRGMLLASILISLVMGVIYYVVTYVLMSRKLNLE